MGVRAYAPREDGNVMLGTAAVGRDPRISARVYRCIYPQQAPGTAHELLCVLLNIYKLVSAYRSSSLAGVSRSSHASLIPFSVVARFVAAFKFEISPRGPRAPATSNSVITFIFRIRFPVSRLRFAFIVLTETTRQV